MKTKLFSFKLLLLIVLSVFSNQAWGQTNPTAQSLPYTFTGMTSGDTALPIGMAMHRFGTTAGTIPSTRTTNVANGDLPISNAIGSGGWWNETNNGISLLASGSNAAGALVVAINTTGKIGINVSWKAGTILQQTNYDNSIALQYRIGTTGTWNNVGTTSTYSTQGKEIGDISALFTEQLPVSAENQSVVQVRWIYWSSNGSSGSRDRINIDEINITGGTTSSSSLAVTGTTAHGATCLGVAATKQTYTITNSGGVAATGIAVASSNPEFVVSNLSSTSIAANGGTATYDVTFTPTTAGGRTATINITSTESATASSSLTGTGTAPVTAVATTNAATAITTSTATLNGNAVFGVCPSTTGKGFVISRTSDNATPTVGGTGVTNRTVTLGSAGNYTYAESVLIPATSYSYRAYVYDGTTYTYGAVQTFSTLTPTANDLCADAISLVANDPAISGTFVNATASPSPFTGSTKDVWYKFTPLCNGKFTFNLSAYSGQAQLYLYASCGTATHIQSVAGVSSNNELTTNNPLVSGTTYYLRLTASNVQAEASTFNISVNNQITINVQPTNQTASVGATATFSTSAPANATEGSSYQWQFSTDNGANWANVVGGTTNATGNQYTTPATTIGMNGYLYRVVITNGTCSTVTSNAAKLTVVKQSSVSDIFRSKQTGAWNIAGSWESFSNGEWIDATLIPSNTAGTITIRTGHTINVTNSLTADQVVVEQGGILDTTTGSLTISNGAGDDLIVNGTLRQTGATTTLTVNAGATVVFNANSLYESYKTTIYPPSATWHVTSTCEIKGSPTSINSGQFNQTFGNLTFDMTPTTNMNFSATTTSFKVVGTMDVKNTGSYALCLNFNVTNAKNYEVGNLIVRGTSELQLSNRNGSTTTGLTNLKITGDLTLEDNSILAFGKGTSDGPDYFSGKPARSIINLGGHLNASTGSSLITGGINDSYGVIEFANTAEKNLSILNPNSNSILFEVLAGSKVKLTNNITLGDFNGFDIEGEFDLGTHEIVGTNGGFNYFYNYADSTLKIAHPEGIGLLENGAYPTTGAVRVDANEAYTYDIDANYVYYGTANQITGTGLPEIVKNLTINNTGAANNNEVTLTGALGLSKDLKVTSGIFNINDKEVVGNMNSTGSDITVSSTATLKIGGTRSFPLDFTTIHLDGGSLVDYAGAAQSIANANVTGYTNIPAYSNLQISGTGVKTAIGKTVVNNLVTVASAELKLPETANNVTSNILEAKQGIHNTGGTVTFENNAILMQDAEATNTGDIILNRKATVPSAQYNIWSSPVASQDLYALYGAAGAVPAGTVMEYITKTDLFKPMPAGSLSVKAKAYSAKGLANNASNAVTAVFKGVPNNADIQIPLSVEGNRFNAVGNPYPSNLDLNVLYQNNVSNNPSGIKNITNLIRFWDNTGNTILNQQGAGYYVNQYAIYNLDAGIGVPGTAATNGDQAKIPDGIVKPGQGFIVRANTSGDHKLWFNNSQRLASAHANTPYYKNSSNKDRFWLALETPGGIVNTIAIAYNDLATNNNDIYDTSILDANNSDLFYSLSDNQYKQAIQSRKGGFVDTDVVKLGAKYYKAGTHKIKVIKKDGVFEGGQNIYLHDKVLNKYIDLATEAYSFDASASSNDTRFEIVYKPGAVLGAEDAQSKDAVVVYKTSDAFVVLSKADAITKVELYDMNGRLIQVNDKAAKEQKLSHQTLSNGAYLLKISRGQNVEVKKVLK